MANTQAIATSFKVDLLNAKHNFGTDAFKASLYVTTAVMTDTATAYTTTDEVSSAGTNYPAAGVAVTFGTAPTSTGTTAYITPSVNIVFTNVTIATPFDCMLLYNNTLVGKNAVAVFTFNPTTITAADFTLSMPVNGATTALLQLV